MSAIAVIQRRSAPPGVFAPPINFDAPLSAPQARRITESERDKAKLKAKRARQAKWQRECRLRKKTGEPSAHFSPERCANISEAALAAAAAKAGGHSAWKAYLADKAERTLEDQRRAGNAYYHRHGKAKRNAKRDANYAAGLTARGTPRIKWAFHYRALKALSAKPDEGFYDPAPVAAAD